MYLAAIGFPIVQAVHAAHTAVGSDGDRVVDQKVLADDMIVVEVTAAASLCLPDAAGLNLRKTGVRKSVLLSFLDAHILSGVCRCSDRRDGRNRRRPPQPIGHAAHLEPSAILRPPSCVGSCRRIMVDADLSCAQEARHSRAAASTAYVSGFQLHN